ncbi:MAG: RHS repeat domain-containing protein, partial [Eubacteriales bacterium]
KGDETKKILDQTDYYPFGMSMNMALHGSGQKNLYKYNGKELQEDKIGNGELDWYDYRARFYDAAIGRWHVVDPLAEDYPNTSLYAYVLSNPLKFTDPDGMRVDIDIYNKNNTETPVVSLKTDDINASFVLPEDVELPMGQELVIGKEKPLIELDINPLTDQLKDMDGDVLMISASIEILALGIKGEGVGIDVFGIGKGKDAGTVSVYKTEMKSEGRLNFSAGGSIGYGEVKYNYGSGVPLDRFSFEGPSKSISIGIKKYGVSNIIGFSKNGKALYNSVQKSLSEGAPFTYSKMNGNSELLWTSPKIFE